MKGYALIGCGYCAGIHAANIASQADAQLVTVYDSNGQNAAHMALRYKASQAESIYEACTQSQVDAVIVATPNNSHVEPVLAALKANKPVLCEKPISLCLADTKRILSTAANSGKSMFAGYVSNFIPGVQKAAQLLDEGEIGKLLTIQAVHTDWAGPQPSVGWKQMKEISGGHLYHHMHEVDLICRFGGMPSSVYCLAKNLAHQGEGFGTEEDAIFLQMELAGGGFASLQIGSAFHLGEHSMRLQGDKGSILLDFKHSCVQVYTNEREYSFGMHENPAQDQERSAGYPKTKADAGSAFGKPGMQTSQWMQSIFRQEFQAFHALVKGDTLPIDAQRLVDGSAVLACESVLDAAETSARIGQKVTLKEECI